MAMHERIKFKDLDGNEVEEDFYFNLNAAELAEMEVEVKGGYKEHLEKILKEDDRNEIVKAFKKILLSSVGRRSEDGRRFLKTQDIVNDFQFSGAYEIMFFKLLGDAEYAVSFVKSVFPKDLAEKLALGNKPVAVDLPTTPPPVPNFASSTPDFGKMSQQDFLDWQRRQQNPLGL